MYKSGFIAIVGRPNAGKSTLMNQLLKEKIAIMSDKPNTTRNNIAGILTKPDAQYVFVDTPGIHKPQQQLGRGLNKNAYSAMEDCDVLAWIVDGNENYGAGDTFILERIQALHKPVILLINKIDQMNKEKLMEVCLNWSKVYDFDEIIPISAKKADNLMEVLKVMKSYLKEGPALFPEEMTSDHDLNFRMCEIVREKILLRTHEEIPHSVAVLLEKSEQKPNGYHLQMLVIVDKKSQKGILIGKQGRMIRSIRLAAQKELSDLLGQRVELELYVRVEQNWRNHEDKIKAFGLDEFDDD